MYVPEQRGPRSVGLNESKQLLGADLGSPGMDVIE
jgi:hypothetical protein